MGDCLPGSLPGWSRRKGSLRTGLAAGVWTVIGSGKKGGWLESPQDCLRYKGRFELKATLASGSRESSAPPCNYLEELELGALPNLTCI